MATHCILEGKSHEQRSLQAMVHSVAKSQTRLREFTITTLLKSKKQN